jgi:hypothetical protein
MRTVIFILLTSTALLAADPQKPISEPVEMAVAIRQAEEQWRAVEPELFTEAGKKHIGTWVRCGGKLLSLQAPVTIKLASGTTVRLTKLQGADRDELGTFREPPSVATVWGPILEIDAASRTVTIKAVSTMFQQ